MDTCALLPVPDPDGPVFGIRQYQVLSILPRIVQYTRDIVEVSTQGINFPRLRFVHTPELDEAIVGARNHERLRRVERSPIDATVMAFQDVLHYRVGAAKDVASCRILRRAIWATNCFVSQARCVPHTDCLIEGSRHDQVFAYRVRARGEARAHDIVIVTCEHSDARTRLPIPNADSLVIGSTQNPWIFVVELDCADVVQVP
mmetsp:Transcript_61993/g.98252  ORF Transcript_61993/g.98252 Transcript_61993/m.98252 type:complete len:202 (+) Transcript_61993:3072-3677(+)